MPNIPFSAPVFNVTIRKFLGHTLAEQLGIEKPSTYEVLKWWFIRYNFVMLSFVNSMLPFLKALQNQCLWNYVDSAYKDFFTIKICGQQRIQNDEPSRGEKEPADAGGVCPFMSGGGKIKSLTKGPFGVFT